MSLLRLLVLVVVLAGLQGAGGPAKAADMFGRAEEPAAAETNAQPQNAVDRLALPAPVKVLIGRAVAVQSRLNGELRTQLQLAKEDGSWRPAAAIVLIAFLYGVFHAVGPGHGKVVVGSYFLTRRARIMHGLAMSGSAALVQALSAIAQVGLLAAVFDLGSRRILDQAAALETASYVIITALGLWMGWGVISGRRCCEHGEAAGHAEHCDHGDHHHHHHHHDHACGHAHHGHETAESHGKSELLRVLTTGAAVGLRPCSGAILVLLFTLANDIFPVGVLATFAMGLGVAITVSVVSLTTLGIHRSAGLLGLSSGAAARTRQIAAFTGAAVITVFGCLQLLGIWTGAITPMAG